MDLVLDLVLEYADTSTLLDCLFLSKHTHAVVMRILKPKFSVLEDLWMVFGDVYLGIKLLNSDISIDRTQYRDNESTKDFIKEHKHQSPGLLEIYARLYYININCREYFYTHNGSLALHIIMPDMAYFVRTCWYRIQINTLPLLILGALMLEDYHWIIEYILDRGFNVNCIFPTNLPDSTTILNFAIKNRKFWAVDLILNKNPNLFMMDRSGHNAVMLFKDRLKDADKTDTFVASVVKKFKALQAKQEPYQQPWLPRTSI